MAVVERFNQVSMYGLSAKKVPSAGSVVECMGCGMPKIEIAGLRENLGWENGFNNSIVGTLGKGIPSLFLAIANQKV